MRSRPPTLARTVAASFALLALTVAVAACDTGDGKELRPPTQPPPTTTTSVPSFSPIDTEPDAADPPETTAAETLPAEFTLLTPWRDGAPIGERHTCDGTGLSPGLSWTGVPDGTAELAIVVVDVDADDYVHWVLTGIGPAEVSMLEGTVPAGAIEGPNDAGGTGWTGPCPPPGPPHRYRFTLHALGQQLEGIAGLPAEELLPLLDEVSIGTATVFGTYGRS